MSTSTAKSIAERFLTMQGAQTLDTIFAEILELPLEQVTDGLTPDSCATWDSLNHLRLITEVESRFGVEFTMAEVQEALSVSKFRQLLAAHTT
jgi:acyl carrier protein